MRTAALRMAMSVLGICLAWMLASGSERNKTPQVKVDRGAMYINSGTVGTESIRIEAVDGSFVLESGKPFQTPFTVDLWNQSERWAVNEVVHHYPDAFALGAKPVVIQSGYTNKPLYGLLAFSTVWESAIGAGSKEYYIEIPRERIVHALDGTGVNAVYQLVNYTRYVDGKAFEDDRYFNWILWVSPTPLHRQ